MRFEEIPFSEIEARIMVEGIGPWANFDEIENNLTLDELLLLHDTLAKSKLQEFRMLAAVQGHDVGDEDEYEDDGEELPQELIDAERAWKKKKQEAIAAGEDKIARADHEAAEYKEIGFGYKRE